MVSSSVKRMHRSTCNTKENRSVSQTKQSRDCIPPMKWRPSPANVQRILPHFVIWHFQVDEQFHIDLEKLSQNIRRILFSVNRNVDQVNQKTVRRYAAEHNYPRSFDIIPSEEKSPFLFNPTKWLKFTSWPGRKFIFNNLCAHSSAPRLDWIVR